MQTALIVVLVIAALLVVSYLFKVREKRKALRAFEAVYQGFTPQPTLTIGSSYGHSTYDVLFDTPADVQAAQAQGLNDRFRLAVAALNEGSGAKDNPFDVDKALGFSYKGELEERMARAREAGRAAGRKQGADKP